MSISCLSSFALTAKSRFLFNINSSDHVSSYVFNFAQRTCSPIFSIRKKPSLPAPSSNKGLPPESPYFSVYEAISATFDFAQSALRECLDSNTGTCRFAGKITGIYFIKSREIIHIRKKTDRLYDIFKTDAGFLHNIPRFLQD